MAEVRSGKGTFPSVVRVEFAAIWAMAGSVSLLLYHGVSRSAWNDPILPLSSRVGLAGLELFALAVGVLVLAIGLGVYTVFVRKPGLARWSRWLALASVTVPVWMLTTAYLISWAVFRATGRFLDPFTFPLVRANAVQMMQHAAHMAPLSLLLLPVIALWTAVLSALIVPRLAVRVSLKGAQRTMVVALLALLLCLLAGWYGNRATVPQMYRIGGFSRTGPLLSLALDGATRLAQRTDPIERAPVIDPRQRPIIPVSEYLATAAATDVQRYNVVVLVVESLRNDQLLATGSEREVMPTVDSIARHAAVFTHNYTQASHSDYADLAILSSHYPLRSPRYHIYPRDPSYPRVLVYDVLKALGYHVGVFSSQNESWSGMINYLQTGSIDRLLHAETFEGPTEVPRRDPYFYRFIKGSKRSGKIDDRFTVSEAIEWIAALEQGPFFIYMNLQDSHVPYEIPADFPARFGSGKVSFPLQFGYFPRDSVGAVMDMYANSLAYVDTQIARLVHFLQQAGLWRRTILVVTGDTGQAFYEHGFAGHANALYDEVMRVPLVIRSPDLAPRTEDVLSQHIDVPPTVLGLLGLPPHPSFQGRDLFASSPEGRRYAFLVGQAAAHQYAVVDGRFKLIFDAGTGEHLLFELETDPGETESLTDERPADVRRLARRLHAWRRAQLEYYANPLLYEEWYPPVPPDSI